MRATNKNAESSMDVSTATNSPAALGNGHSRCPFYFPVWLFYTAVTMFLWGGWGLLSKPVADRMSPWQAQAFSALGLLPVVGLLLFSRELGKGRNTQRGFWLAFGSGLVGSVGNVAYYAALGAGGKAAAVTPLSALYPAVTIALAIIFLRERLNLLQLIGAALSLAAIYVLNVGPDSSWLTPWVGLVLVPIGLWGCSAVLQKYAAVEASSQLATVGFLVGELPLSFLT